MVSPVAQQMIAAGGIHSSRIDVAPPPGQPALNEVKFIPVDLDLIEEPGAGAEGEIQRDISVNRSATGPTKPLHTFASEGD